MWYVHASTKSYNNLFTSLILNKVLDSQTLTLCLKGIGDATTYCPDDNYFYMRAEYYGAAEPPVRCGESHLSGLTEPPHFIY